MRKALRSARCCTALSTINHLPGRAIAPFPFLHKIRKNNMGIFSALGKIANQVTEKFDNLVNEEELDACVAACVLVAAADGNISEQEKETAFNLIAGHESLKTFSRDKIRAKFNSDANLINADRELAT